MAKWLDSPLSSSSNPTSAPWVSIPPRRSERALSLIRQRGCRAGSCGPVDFSILQYFPRPANALQPETPETPARWGYFSISLQLKAPLPETPGEYLLSICLLVSEEHDNAHML